MSGDVLRQAATQLRTEAGDAVSLALADWLEQEDDLHGTYDCRYEPCAAVATARAVLGDPS